MGLFHRLSNIFSPSPKRSSDIVTDGDYRWFGGGSWIASDTHAGEVVTQDSLMTSATCYACTKALSESIAGLPGSIYRLADDMQTEDKSQFAYELLAEQPNPEMDSFTFWEMAISRLVNRGNFFAEIQRDKSDRPIALWPIHNSRVEPMREPDGSLYWQVSSNFSGAAQYEDPSWRKENLAYISPRNMLNVVGFGSSNGIMAPGMLPGSQEIAIDFATRRYGGSFFGSGAKPAGIVEHPGFIPNEGQRNQFRADINQLHSGAANAHKIGVLWQGAKYNQIGVNPEQAQFLQTRKFTSHQLCKFYGVPPAIIGDYEDSKFATADAMIRAFVMLTLRNLVVRVEKAVNRQVLNVRNSDGRLQRAFSKPLIYNIAIDGLLRGDPKTQAETHQIYRASGILNTNEIREEIGFNPIKGEHGDFLIVNGGMSRLDKIDEQGTRQDQPQQDQGQQQDQQASLPTFDKAKLAEMIAASGLCEPQSAVQVRGATLDNPLVDVVVDLCGDAVARIHKIANTQIERWREQDPSDVASKMPQFWTKQDTRLREALEPAAKVALRVSPDADIVSVLANKYAQYGKLDNYQIFDSKLMELFDVATIVKGELE